MPAVLSPQEYQAQLAAALGQAGLTLPGSTAQMGAAPASAPPTTGLGPPPINMAPNGQVSGMEGISPVGLQGQFASQLGGNMSGGGAVPSLPLQSSPQASLQSQGLSPSLAATAATMLAQQRQPKPTMAADVAHAAKKAGVPVNNPDLLPNGNDGRVAAGDLVFPGGGDKPKPAAGGGVTTVGATELPTIDPKRIAAIDNAQRSQIAAAQDITDIEAHQAEDKGVSALLLGKKLSDQQAEITTKAKERDDYLKLQEDKISKLSSDVANQRIDPDHWWHSQSTGDQIRYTIAGVLGGFLQGYQGRKTNFAMDEINRRIDNDIGAQKEAILSKRGQIGDMQGLLASAYRRFGNMEQAEAATRAVALQQFDAEQQGYAAGSDSQLVLAKSQQLSAQMQEAREKSLAGLYKYAPAHQVGGTPDLHADYRKYTIAELAKPGGAAVDYPTFVRMVTGEGGASIATAPGKHGGAAPNIPAPSSVAWDPRRHIQGTEAFGHAQGQDRWNSAVLAAVHQQNPAAKGLEAMEHIGSAYLVKPGDTQQTIDRKVEAFHSDFGAGGAQSAGPSYSLSPITDEE